MSDTREKINREIIKHQRSNCDCGLCTGDRDFTELILSIVREAVKERKPLTAKPIRKGQKITKRNEGYNEGVSNYHDALMEVLS